MVDAYPKYIEMVELNYLDIPLTGSNPVLTTMSKRYSVSLIQDLNNGFARVGQR